MCNAWSQNLLSRIHVVVASVSFNVAQAVSQNLVPFVFHRFVSESPIKRPSSKRPFCGLNISVRVHPIELKFSGEKYSTEIYTSPECKRKQCNLCFPISVQIGRKTAFFDQLWPSISRDWTMIETHHFAQRDMLVAAIDRIILSPLEWSIETGRSDQTLICLEKALSRADFLPK
jgi:hypothetical protein